MFRALILALAAAAAIAGTVRSDTASDQATTLSDLQAAYNLECNAETRYEVYAKSADGEGYHKVASLMRAAARGEAIHAANHAAAIRELGGKPVAEVQPVFLKTTRANLVAAIAEEGYERDRMYPIYMRQARDAQCTGADRSFTLARDAEMTHATLFKAALDNLDQMKRKETFFVCPVCGSVMANYQVMKCLDCGTTPEKFLRIS